MRKKMFNFTSMLTYNYVVFAKNFFKYNFSNNRLYNSVYGRLSSESVLGIFPNRRTFGDRSNRLYTIAQLLLVTQNNDKH